MDISAKIEAERLNYLKNHDEVAQSVKKICILHDVRARVILFGSTLRGDWNIDSDIDLIIILSDLKAKDRIVVDIYRTIDAPVELHFATEDIFEKWYLRFIDVYREI